MPKQAFPSLAESNQIKTKDRQHNINKLKKKKKKTDRQEP